MLDQIMWLFTVPVLKVAIQVVILISFGFLIIQIARWAWQSTTPNPFAEVLNFHYKLHRIYDTNAIF